MGKGRLCLVAVFISVQVHNSMFATLGNRCVSEFTDVLKKVLILEKVYVYIYVLLRNIGVLDYLIMSYFPQLYQRL